MYATLKDLAAASLLEMIKNGEDGTVSVKGTDLPTTGYWVGGLRPSLTFSPSFPVRLDELKWFVKGSHADYYGVWTDAEDGTVYVDAVSWEEHREAALKEAASRGELAVWDIASNTEVRTGVERVSEGSW